MRISEITVQNVADFLRLDETDQILLPMMAAAKQFIMDYTGLTEDELEDHEDFYIAYMVLIQDMYDNRSMYVEKSNINHVVDSILFRHRLNLV